MKLFAAILVCLMGSSAFASKARVESLQGASHVVDVQTVFTAPSHLMLVNPFLTFEFGTEGTQAEGGVMRTFENGHRLLAYLGHQNSTESAAAGDLRDSNGYLTQNNPIEIIYGFGNMAFGTSFSMVDNKKSKTKEQTVVAKWGMNIGDGWVYAHIHALSKAEKDNAGDTDTMNSAPYITLGGSFELNSFRLFGELDFGRGKYEPGADGAENQDIDDTNISVGIEDRSLRKEGADIYYGIRLDYASRSIEKTDITAIKLPAFIGIEYTMNSWATARASLQQNILLGDTKDETNPPGDREGIDPDTKVAAGLGLKWNNLTLDGSLVAAGNADGKLNAADFLQHASLTYNF